MANVSEHNHRALSLGNLGFLCWSAEGYRWWLRRPDCIRYDESSWWWDSNRKKDWTEVDNARGNAPRFCVALSNNLGAIPHLAEIRLTQRCWSQASVTSTCAGRRVYTNDIWKERDMRWTIERLPRAVRIKLSEVFPYLSFMKPHFTVMSWFIAGSFFFLLSFGHQTPTDMKSF